MEVQAMPPKRFTPDLLLQVLKLYAAGESYDSIGKAVGFKTNTVRKRIKDHINLVANVESVNQAKANGYKANAHPEKLVNPALINKDFENLLSPPDGDNLTEAEVKYCWALVGTNNQQQALEAAGMDIGLTQHGQGGAAVKVEGYEYAAKMRIVHLKSKPNVLAFIKKLRQDSVFKADVDKDYLQKQIMIQLDELDNDTSSDARKLKRDYIQLLGRTFGGFTEKIEVGYVDHASSVKTLAEHARKTEKLAELKVLKQKKLESEKKDNGVVSSGQG